MLGIMPEKHLYARCQDCSSVITGLLEWTVLQYEIYIEWESALAVAVRGHHSSIPSGFGHNEYYVYLTESQAQINDLATRIASLIVSRASIPYVIIRDEEPFLF